MNLRCSFCQTPFTLGRVEKLDALQEMYAKNLNHYDAHCPRCRRATPVPRQKLEMTMPNWRAELVKLEAELLAHPQQEAPLPARQPAPVPQAESKPETVPAPAPKPESKPKPAPKPKTQATAKPAAAKASATKSKAPAKTSSPKAKATKKSK
jgi:hypothetical protein